MDAADVERFFRENALGGFLVSTASGVAASLVYALIAGSGKSAETLGGTREYRIQRAFALRKRVATLSKILDPQNIGRIAFIPLLIWYWKIGAQGAESLAIALGIDGWVGIWPGAIVHFFIFAFLLQVPMQVPGIVLWGERRRLQKWLFLMKEGEIAELNARTSRNLSISSDSTARMRKPQVSKQ